MSGKNVEIVRRAVQEFNELGFDSEGKICRWQAFWDKQRGLAAAGLTE
jgi:hypothetical protein